MKRKHIGSKRCYSLLSKAWYASSSLTNQKYVDEVTLGLYGRDGGTTGEFCIRWIHVGNNAVATPHLEAFSDSWSAIANWYRDVLDMMAKYDSEDITPERFCVELDKLGIINHTQTTQAR